MVREVDAQPVRLDLEARFGIAQRAPDLHRYFARTEESDAEIATPADVAVGLMFTVIAPLGQLLTTLPVGFCDRIGAGAPSLTAPIGRMSESLRGFANRLVLAEGSR